MATAPKMKPARAAGKKTSQLKATEVKTSTLQGTANQYGFAGFSAGDWESNTPNDLRPAVCILREKIQAMARDHFDKLQQDCYAELHDYRSRGREMAIFATHVSRLRRWMTADAACLYANDFRKIAQANVGEVDGDPFNWAYAQIRSTLYGFLNMPKGATLIGWLISVCDGEALTTSNDLLSIVKAGLKRTASWRVPTWLYAHLSDRQSDKAYNPENTWNRLSLERTDGASAKFASDFWTELEAGLINQMQNLRVALALRATEPRLREQANCEEDAGRETAAVSADASKLRASEVQRVMKELTMIRPLMTPQASYRSIRSRFPDSVAFTVCDAHKDLKLKLENIQEHQQFVRFAIEIVAAKYGRKFNTVEKDWKTHKPRKEASPQTRRTTP